MKELIRDGLCIWLLIVGGLAIALSHALKYIGEKAINYAFKYE